MAAKKATTSASTKYYWFAQHALHRSALNDDCAFSLGQFVSIESVLNSTEFSEFMSDADYPERVYLLAVMEDGKPHRFHRIEVKQAGFSYKEV